MELQEILDQRQSYRSFAPVEITESLIEDLANCAKSAPSCYNKQPWRFVFAYEKEVLEQLFGALVEANQWARQASMIIGVFSEASLDCQNDELDYFLFDTGMATSIMILRITELGLVAHPIAGFDFSKAKEIFNIPDHMTMITLLVVGKKTDQINPLLNEKAAAAEKVKTPRKPFSEFAFLNRFESR